MIDKDWVILISDYAELSLLIAAVLSLLIRARSKVSKMLSVYLFSLGALNYIASKLADLEIHNWFMYHIIGLLELVITILVYRSLGLKKHWKALFVIGPSLYLLDSVRVLFRDFSIHKSSTQAEPLYVNNLGLGLVSLITLALGVGFLYKLFKEKKVKAIETHAEFYINTGFMLYAAASFIFFITSTFIVSKSADDQIFYSSWLFISVFLMIKSLLITIGLILDKRCSQT